MSSLVNTIMLAVPRETCTSLESYLFAPAKSQLLESRQCPSQISTTPTWNLYPFQNIVPCLSETMTVRTQGLCLQWIFDSKYRVLRNYQYGRSVHAKPSLLQYWIYQPFCKFVSWQALFRLDILHWLNFGLDSRRHHRAVITKPT
jgi:hypothetical protein